jgi:hypothetical protein
VKNLHGWREAVTPERAKDPERIGEKMPPEGFPVAGSAEGLRVLGAIDPFSQVVAGDDIGMRKVALELFQ